MKAVILLFLALTPTILHAQAAVWKISLGDHYLYIGGTVHLLARSDYPLPNAYEAAYIDATTIAFETDMDQLESPEFQRLLLEKNVYPEGVTLQAVLDNTTYNTLNNYLLDKKIPLEMLNSFKPGMLASVLTVMELQQLGLADEGVDMFFNKRAQRDQKQRLALESVETQIDFLSTMGEGIENAFIEYMISDLKKLPEEILQIKVLWREGDTAKSETLLTKPLEQQFPQIFQRLLVERNQNWLPQLQKMLTTEPVELVLVGYAHLLGKEGLLAQLANSGANIEQLP